MLDLDALAAKRAKLLSQSEEAWSQAVWSADFQKISASMSDGEVESLISLCPSAAHLREVIKFLFHQTQNQNISPFNVLTQEADKAGLQPADWVRAQVGPNT